MRETGVGGDAVPRVRPQSAARKLHINKTTIHLWDVTLIEILSSDVFLVLSLDADQCDAC